MIRARLDAEHKRIHQTNPYEDGLQETMRQLRASTKKGSKLVLNSQESDVHDDYFMDAFDD
jgi:hypothetical protein